MCVGSTFHKFQKLNEALVRQGLASNNATRQKEDRVHAQGYITLE